MRFSTAHKLVSYLMVLAALAALASTRALDGAAGMAFLIAATVSLAADPGSRLAALLERRKTMFRISFAVVLTASVWHVVRRLPEPAPAFEPLLVLLAYKLFLRGNHRDYLHIFALAFLLVLLASTFAASAMFVLAFGLYAVLAVWGLMLFNLRREMEENYLIKHSAAAPSEKVGVARILGSRRVVGRAFFVATAAVAVVVVAGGTALFLLLPRLGAGLVLGSAATSPTMTGFGDEVALGRYGTSAGQSRQVLLRASVDALAAITDDDARRDAIEHLYFRGAVFDRYDHGRWTHARLPELRTGIETDGQRHWIAEQTLERRRAQDAGARGVIPKAQRQQIELCGLPGTVLFAVDRPLGFELPAERLGARSPLRVVPRWSGEAALRVGSGADDGEAFITLAHARYTAYSSDPLLSDLQMTRLPPAVRSAYLVVPPELTARVGALADRIAAGAGSTSDAAKAGAIVDWLQAHHGYSAEPPLRPGVDPVEDFIFGHEPGHCELFASATVLLLRASGVPARYVTGFRGGDWNALGGYVAVRDDRAHAWAEAFVMTGGLGQWTRVDATPPGPAPAALAGVAQLADAIEHLWTSWVVGFDLGRQQDLIQRVGRRLGTLVGGDARARKRNGALGAADLLPGVLLMLAGVMLIAVARRMPRTRDPMIRWPHIGREQRARNRAERRNAIAVERLYRRTLARLTRAGWPKWPTETPREYARRLREWDVIDQAGQSGAARSMDALERLAERYGAARFGGHAVDEETIVTLTRELAAIDIPAKLAAAG